MSNQNQKKPLTQEQIKDKAAIKEKQAKDGKIIKK